MMVVGLFVHDTLGKQHTSKVGKSQRKTTGGERDLTGSTLLPTHPSSSFIPRGKRVFPHGAGDLGWDGTADVPFLSDMC